MNNDIKKTLQVVVKTPDGVLFEGEADAITTVNKNGILDVLPLHENFISRIQEKLIIHQKQHAEKEFPIQTGILKVSSNTVQVFLGMEKI